MAGFHIGVRGKAAGQVVRCTAREGACKLTVADGEPTPHFASLADGEAYLAEQENAEKGGFTPAANSEATPDSNTTTGDTEGDTSAGGENEVIDYDEIIADAAESREVREHFKYVTENLEALNSNRDWFTQHIVSPSGDIPNPHIFPTASDKIKLLQQADNYYKTAEESEREMSTFAQSLQAALGSDAALALTAQVHRLTHQEGEVGDLLRDLQDKGALLGQASEKLRETMDAYPRDTIDAMRAHTFKDEIDGNGWPYDSYYLLYTHELKPIQDMKNHRNAQLFATTILASLDNDSIDKYKKAESDLFTFVENAAEAYNKTREHSQE